MNKCHTSDYATIEHDEEFNLLILTWQRFVEGKEFRDTIMLFYDLTEEKGITNWCFDSRKQNLVAPGDQKWTVDELVRRGYHNSARKTAVIMPESLFMEVSVDKISQNLEKNNATPLQERDNFKQFPDREQALTWLRTTVTNAV